jgi:hypothetical protein
MNKLKGIVFLTVVVALASSALAAESPFLQAVATTKQTAVMAPYAASIIGANVVCALSVSNVLAAPVGILPAGLSDTQGTVEFYLYNADGSLTVLETATSTLGNGALTADGQLLPGRTLTVFVHEILAAAGLPSDTVFQGYIWVVANFDGVQGTVTTLQTGYGFAQTLNDEPTTSILTFAGYNVNVP